MIVHIPLDQLSLSAMNVRKTQSTDAQEEMKASLFHHGLQQNLVVVAQSEDAYEVIAGGRRLVAMQAIAAAGEIVPNIGEDWRIPCQVIDAGDATEISLAENTVREAMHPADQYEAWSKMIADGKTPAEVALRFGVSEQVVRRRLKLAAVAPDLMDAFRAGKISLENLMAFALTDDHVRQLDVWEKVKSEHSLGAHYIRRLLTEDAVSGNSKLARFVGEDAYERAGGIIERDLFTDHSYFENAALLEALAMQKLDSAAEALQQEWAFVQASFDCDRTLLHSYDTLEPRISGAPEELMQEYETKLQRYMDLQNGDFTEEEAEDEEALQAESEELEETLEQLQQQLEPFRHYTAEQKQQSGCFVYVSHNGELEIRYGQQKRQRQATGNAVGSGTEGQGTGSPVDAMDAGFSQSLTADLAIYRTQILQAAIGDDFASAFDLTTYSLCVRLFTAEGLNITERSANGMGYLHSPLNVGITPYSTRTSLQDADSTPAGIRVAEQFDGLSLLWMRLASEQLRFAAFCELPEDEKRKLFSWCVARNVQSGLADRMSHELEAVATRLNVQAHEVWRPDESSFFKRLKKPQLLALITEVIGAQWCSKMADQKKGQIASWLGRVFAGNPASTAGMNSATLERIRCWMPAKMAFFTDPAQETTPEQGEETADVVDHADAQANVVPMHPEAEVDTGALPEWMADLGDAA